MQVSMETNSDRISILLNPSHSIFEGHFPGSPVLPGVCMVQIIKELLYEIVDKKIILRKGQTIKFQNPVNPLVNPALTFVINRKFIENSMTVSVQVSNETMNFCSFKGEFEFV